MWTQPHDKTSACSTRKPCQGTGATQWAYHDDKLLWGLHRDRRILLSRLFPHSDSGLPLLKHRPDIPTLRTSTDHPWEEKEISTDSHALRAFRTSAQVKLSRCGINIVFSVKLSQPHFRALLFIGWQNFVSTSLYHSMWVPKIMSTLKIFHR